MKIGIIGTGMIGSTLATLWAKAGHELFIGARDLQKPQELVRNIGNNVQIGSLIDAAKWGDVILESIPLFAIPELGSQIAKHISGKILLDTANPYPRRDGVAAEEVEKLGQGSGVWVAKHFPAARVVKAFNTVHFETLRKEAHRSKDPIGIPLAGDDKAALITTAQLVSDAGFEAVIIGGLPTAKKFGPGTPAYNTGAAAVELRKIFGIK